MTDFLGPTERRLATRKQRLSEWSARALGDWEREKDQAGRILGGYRFDADGNREPVVHRTESSGQKAEGGDGMGYSDDQLAKARRTWPNQTAAEPRRAYGGSHAAARVSAEQEINWGNTKPSIPAGKGSTTQEWGKTLTGIALNSQERQGVLTDFKAAAQTELKFTRYIGQTLLNIAQTYDGFSTLYWCWTKAEIRSYGLKQALQKFMTDPRCAEAVQVMKDRDAKRAAKA